MLRIIGFFSIFALFLAFIMLNLENKSSVNFGFHAFNDVPVYITVFISIFAGMVFAIPVISALRRKKDHSEIRDNSKKKNKASLYRDETSSDNGPYGIN